MASKKKSQYDDLTPYSNLPSSSIYGPKKYKSPNKGKKPKKKVKR